MGGSELQKQNPLAINPPERGNPKGMATDKYKQRQSKEHVHRKSHAMLVFIGCRQNNQRRKRHQNPFPEKHKRAGRPKAASPVNHPKIT